MNKKIVALGVLGAFLATFLVAHPTFAQEQNTAAQKTLKTTVQKPTAKKAHKKTVVKASHSTKKISMKKKVSTKK